MCVLLANYANTEKEAASTRPSALRQTDGCWVMARARDVGWDGQCVRKVTSCAIRVFGVWKRQRKRASLVAQRLKRLPASWETWVQSLGREDPLEKEVATHSSILSWRIPWTESLVGYSPWGCKESDTTERLHFHFQRHRKDVMLPFECSGSGQGKKWWEGEPVLWLCGATTSPGITGGSLRLWALVSMAQDGSLQLHGL